MSIPRIILLLVFVLFNFRSLAEETHRGIVRRPNTVTCTAGCGDLFLEPDSGIGIIYLTNAPQSQYLGGGHVGLHVQVTGYRARCSNRDPLFITREPIILPPTDIRNVSNTFPEQFSLRQNFSNPFNPATVIQYFLPAEGVIDLSIFDALGRHVVTLLSEKQRAGIYQHEWNAINQPSSMYVARISYWTTQHMTQVQLMPMMLLR